MWDDRKSGGVAGDREPREARPKDSARRSSTVAAIEDRRLSRAQKGIYLDGEGATHSSLHANMFPLALGLVPDENKWTVAQFIKSRGMVCSVYGAQYLLKSLYAADEDEYALGLLTSKDTRSWFNMLRVGSTISMEAWDLEYKPNLDWNHAWGAAPANLIPRYVMGVRPLEPGLQKALIQPQPGTLEHASGTIPTIRGPIQISFKNNPPHAFDLNVKIPANMAARVGLPQMNAQSRTILVDGKKVEGELRNMYLFVDGIGSGSHTLLSQ